MLILFISIILSLSAFTAVSKQYFDKMNVFRRSTSIIGRIADIVHLESRIKKQHKIKIVYNINEKQYHNNVLVSQEKCNFQVGDQVTLLYDYKNPKNSLATIDFYSCLRAYQKVIMTITFIAVFMIALRSILIYAYPDNSKFIDVFASAVIGICFISLLLLYIPNRYALSKKRYIATGTIERAIGTEKQPMYEVSYCVGQYTFHINCTICNKEVNIGDVVRVTYLPKKPFIAEIIN